MGMFDPKKRKIITAVIAVILVLAMVVPSVLSILLGSIIFFVGLTLPRYRFSKPSASLDMNLR